MNALSIQLDKAFELITLNIHNITDNGFLITSNHTILDLEFSKLLLTELAKRAETLYK